VRAGRAVIAWRDARAGTTTSIYTSALVDAATTGVERGTRGAPRLVAGRGLPGRALVHVTLPAAGPATLELLDVAGRRLASTRLQGPLEDHAESLGNAAPPGLYFVRLRTATGEASTRVPVQR
jgi:hypothetical protein